MIKELTREDKEEFYLLGSSLNDNFIIITSKDIICIKCAH